MLKPKFLACVMHKKSNFSSFSYLVTLLGHLATLKWGGTPSLRTAAVRFLFFSDINFSPAFEALS